MRPFITAYKNRSSKSRTARPWDIDDPEKTAAKPLTVDLGATPAASGPDAEYLAAMAAADAVFGGKAVETAAFQEPPNVPVSRILPCLLQPDEQPAPSVEKAKKAPRTPRAAKPAQRNADKAEGVAAPIKRAPAQKTVEPPPVVVTTDSENVGATRRERSSLQSRWVRKSALKPGEKWKRRLCKAAR